MAGVAPPTPPAPPASTGSATGQSAAAGTAAAARNVREVVLEQVPARLAELGRAVVLTGTPDGRTPEGALRLRTQMGEILLRPAEAFAPDRPVTLQIPAASPPGTLPTRAVAFTPAAAPAPATGPAAPAAPPAVPAMTGPAPPPSVPTAALLPGTVLTATIVTAGPAATVPVMAPGDGTGTGADPVRPPVPPASLQETASALPQASPRGVPAITAAAAYGAMRGSPGAGGPPAPQPAGPAIALPASASPPAAAPGPTASAAPAATSAPIQGPAGQPAPDTAIRQAATGTAMAPDMPAAGARMPAPPGPPPAGPSPADQIPPERGGAATQARPPATPAPAAEAAGRQPLSPPPPSAAGAPAFPAAGLRPGTAVMLHVLSLPPAPSMTAAPTPATPTPTTPTPMAPMPPGPSLGGVVTGMSAASGTPQAVLSTAQGAVLVQPGAPLPIGTQVALTLAPAAAPPPPFDPLNGNGWPNLQRTLDALVQADAGGARALMMQILPQAGPRLAAAMAHFTNAVGKGAEAKRWIGEPAARLLEAEGREEVLSALDRDFKAMGRQAAEPMQGEWRAYSLPFSDGQEISRIRFFVRKAGDEEEGTEGNGRAGGRAQRFVLDLELSRLGPIQLDGLVRDRRFDLILRMRDPFPEDIRREIQGIFTRTLAALGLSGDASFQPGGRGWVTIQPKPGTERGFLA